MAKMGAPTKYSQKMVDKAKDYLKNYRDYGDKCNIPLIEVLALQLDISKDTIYEWCKHDDKKDFSDVVIKIKLAQAARLIDGGLSGDYNSKIAALMLCKHGYTEKKEIEVTEKPFEGVSDEELERKRRLLLDEMDEGEGDEV